MKKIQSFGRALSREEMKKLKGGEGINPTFACSCNGQTWSSTCETLFCLTQEGNNRCGYGSNLHCTRIPE